MVTMVVTNGCGKRSRKGRERNEVHDQEHEAAAQHRPVGGDAVPQGPRHGRAREDLPHSQRQDEKQAEKARNDLILALERKGGAAGTHLTVAEFVKMVVDAKTASGTIESSTVRDYHMQARTMARYIGDAEVAESVPLPCVLT